MVAHKSSRTIFAAFIVLLLAVSSVSALMLKPLNLSPENGEVINDRAPVLEWGGGTAETYKIVVKNALGEKVFKTTGTEVNLCTLSGSGSLVCSVDMSDSDALLYNGTHTWKVIAKSAEGEKAKGDPTSFTVNYPGSPILSSPDNGAVVNPEPVLEWEMVDVALLLYRVKLKNTQTGAKHNSEWIGNAEICSDGVCTYETDLGPGNYKWKVQAGTLGAGWVSKSEGRTFTVQPPISG